MSPSVVSLSRSRMAAFPKTRLSQFCNSNRLFRDRYELVKPLGRGGFGLTFLARNAALPGSPECVIKQLCPKTTNEVVLRRATERFEREAKSLAQLGSHAQIPQLLDYFQEGQEFFLVQEYVHGVDLAREVRQKGVLSELAVKRFLREILPVLSYVHQNQVIHRDIKPPNIIRCKDDGRLVLIDFGAVKEHLSEIEYSSQRAPTTQFVGTVGFSPPEQIALRPVFASDIYAIGVTCLYLMTGRSPMEFDIDPRTGEIQWQTMICVSNHFGKVLEKMLRVAVRDRYQDAEQVLRALELEPYIDNLSDCMNAKPLGGGDRLASEEESGDAYLTPMARTAQNIRNWRKRLEEKQKKQWQNPELVKSGCCI